MARHDAPDLVADAEVRVQRLHRVLKNHCDTAATHGIEVGLRRAKQLFSVEQNAAPGLCITRQQAQNRKRRLRFSGNGLADQPDRLARPDGERQLVDHRIVAVANCEVANGQQTHSGLPRIEQVAQTVTQEVETHQDQRQQSARNQQCPRRRLHQFCTIVDERAERGLRLLYTETHETQERLDEYCLRNRQCDVNDHDANQVGRDVPQNNPAALAHR